MAYISQDKKKALEPAIKALLNEYGLKGSLRVDHATGLTLTISTGAIDFIGNYNERGDAKYIGSGYEHMWQPATGHIQTNKYHLSTGHSGRAFEALDRLYDAMNVGNHDNSDSMTDYFDVGWYTYINIGTWNKPYTCTAPAASELEAA